MAKKSVVHLKDGVTKESENKKKYIKSNEKMPYFLF